MNHLAHRIRGRGRFWDEDKLATIKHETRIYPKAHEIMGLDSVAAHRIPQRIILVLLRWLLRGDNVCHLECFLRIADTTSLTSSIDFVEYAGFW